MGGIYGRSRIGKLIQEGRYDEAVSWATQALATDPGDLEARVERAQALSALGRYAEATVDLEQALVLDDGSGELDIDQLDDAYFTALLEVARERATVSLDAGADELSRYAAVFAPPRGQHHADVDLWTRRIRGQVPPTLIIKERD
jgi:tetratricopeptide (TPR) repeat protein